MIWLFLKPILYRRYVDDIYNRGKENVKDSLFKALNSYYKNIELTVEINPIKVFDTYLHNKNGTFVAIVYRKEIEIPAHWSLQIPKRYTESSIKADLHCAKKISINFKKDITFIKNKFTKSRFCFTVH